MGLFEEIFGKTKPTEIQIAVAGYFLGNNEYASVRRCLRDLVARPMSVGTVNQAYTNAVVNALLSQLGKSGHCPGINDHIIMQHLVAAMMLRCASPTAVNVIYTDRTPHVWIDNGVTLNKCERELRFSLLHGPKGEFAWTSLYDDGTRISPEIPGVSGMTGWKTAMDG